jgi:hypothetical protein
MPEGDSKKLPAIAPDGHVKREAVLRALRTRCAVASTENDGETLTISRPSNDGAMMNPIVVKLPEFVSRRFVQQLSRTFEVPVHLFWNASGVG